jgi:hypothetical protein
MKLRPWSKIPGPRARKLLRVLYGPEALIAAEAPAGASSAKSAGENPTSFGPHPLPRPHFAANRAGRGAATPEANVVTAP